MDNLRIKLGWYLLRWFCGLADIIQGILVTATLGFYQPAISLTMQRIFLDFSDEFAEELEFNK